MVLHGDKPEMVKLPGRPHPVKNRMGLLSSEVVPMSEQMRSARPNAVVDPLMFLRTPSSHEPALRLLWSPSFCFVQREVWHGSLYDETEVGAS